MTDTAMPKGTKVSAGGFLIDIQTDELTVTAEKSAVQPRKKSPLRVSFIVIVSLFLAAYILFALIPEIVDKGASYLAALVLIFVPSLLWAYLRGSKNLHCTRESLEVIRIARGKVRERWLPKRSRQRDSLRPGRVLKVWIEMWLGLHRATQKGQSPLWA
jgi:hypothetical protein